MPQYSQPPHISLSLSTLPLPSLYLSRSKKSNNNPQLVSLLISLPDFSESAFPTPSTNTTKSNIRLPLVFFSHHPMFDFLFSLLSLFSLFTIRPLSKKTQLQPKNLLNQQIEKERNLLLLPISNQPRELKTLSPPPPPPGKYYRNQHTHNPDLSYPFCFRLPLLYLSLPSHPIPYPTPPTPFKYLFFYHTLPIYQNPHFKTPKKHQPKPDLKTSSTPIQNI